MSYIKENRRYIVNMSVVFLAVIIVVFLMHLNMSYMALVIIVFIVAMFIPKFMPSKFNNTQEVK